MTSITFRQTLLAIAYLGCSAAYVQANNMVDLPANLDAPLPATSHGTTKHKQRKQPKARKHHAAQNTGIQQPLAVKQTQPPEIDLPGVMKIKGADAKALDFSRARTLPFYNGASQTVWLSKTAPNLLQMPFVNPKIVGRDSLIVSKEEDSNNVYISFDPKYKPDEKHPEQIFVEGPNHVVAAYLLVPKDIPAQSLLVEDQDHLIGANIAKRSDGYVANIQDLMETLATGGVPSGFSVIDLQRDKGLGPIAMHGVAVTPLKKLSGRANDIFVYEVKNPGLTVAKLSEDEFDGPSVAAISIYPKPVLAAGEAVKVFVMTRKDKAE